MAAKRSKGESRAEEEIPPVVIDVGADELNRKVGPPRAGESPRAQIPRDRSAVERIRSRSVVPRVMS